MTKFSFNLKHPSRASCLIDEGSNFLLTGGYDTRQTVSRYDASGWIEDLENLNDGRYDHGCAQYEDDFNNKVDHRH